MNPRSIWNLSLNMVQYTIQQFHFSDIPTLYIKVYLYHLYLLFTKFSHKLESGSGIQSKIYFLVFLLELLHL
jgi:hypothetical protein